jgi:hypothetical protein
MSGKMEEGSERRPGDWRQSRMGMNVDGEKSESENSESRWVIDSFIACRDGLGRLARRWGWYIMTCVGA